MTDFQAVKGVKRVTENITWDAAFGSYDPSFPVTNLKTLPLARICRTSDDAVTSTRYKGTLDKARPVRLLGLVRHNISLDGLVRVRLYGGSEKIFTVDAATNIATVTAHGLTTAVPLTVWSTTTLPGGLVYGTIYYPKVLDANTFTLHTSSAHATAGTSPVDITTTGTGTHKLLSDLIYDSGWAEVWLPVYLDTAEWEDDNWWSGKYSAEEIAGYSRVTRPFFLDAIYLTTIMTVEVDDTSNEDGRIDFGIIEAAKGWQFGVNFQTGAQFGFRFRSREVEAWGGTKEFERLDKPRTFTGSIDLLDHDETMEQAFEDLRQSDITEPFLWMPHPSEPKHWLRDTIFARNLDPGKFSYATQGGHDSVPLSHEEVL